MGMLCRLPSDHDCHSPTKVPSASSNTQQQVFKEPSKGNVSSILQQKEPASKDTSQAGNKPSTSQQGEYVALLLLCAMLSSAKSVGTFHFMFSLNNLTH